MARSERLAFGTLFQSIGLALKQGEEFVRSFNIEKIKCIEAKLTKVTQDMEALENKKRNNGKKEKRKPQEVRQEPQEVIPKKEKAD